MTHDPVTLGAKDCVTGSCHLLRANGANIMVDCGRPQGRDACVPMEKWPIKPSEIDYLFLTHAHIDHIGRVPEMIQNGFKGEIIATHPTKALLVPMLEDALSFTPMPRAEADRIIQSIDDLSWGFEYGETFELRKGIHFRMGNAGHILGSCFLRLEVQTQPPLTPNPSPITPNLAPATRHPSSVFCHPSSVFITPNPLPGASHPSPWTVIFSGDLGAKNTPLLPDPDPPGSCDLLVLESTYGDRLHEEREHRTRRLGEILTRALSDRGKVFIPAFALGRAQELIYELERLVSDPGLQRAFPALTCKKVPVCVDSPLGLELTRIYSGLKPYWDAEARQLLRRGDNPLDFDQLYAVRSHQDHVRLLDMPGPAVIIAGSGMCTGGRIVDHLKTGLQDPRNDVLFVGYQARGTAGREIIQYAKSPAGYVNLDGENIPIRAGVHNLTGYSAHADQRELLEWVRSMPKKPGCIRLVHGEPSAQAVLAAHLRREGYAVDDGP